MGIHPEQPEREQDQAVTAVCVCLNAVHFICVGLCGQTCVYAYMYCVYVCMCSC